MDFTFLSKKQIETIKAEINFTDDEEIIFNMLSRGKSIRQIADSTQMCTRSVDRRISNIKKKIRNYINVAK